MPIVLKSWRSILSTVLLVAGCGSSAMPTVDGGPPKVLEILDPPGAQIGLHYGATVDLAVRYRLDDPAGTPVSNATVKFAIFDDPGGSTLATDRATTDDNGRASVKLTAGAEEKSFRVRAQAPDAPDAVFGVSVSSQAFVNIDVELAYGGNAQIGMLQALLFVGAPCATLPPDPDAATAFRVVMQPGGPMGTVHFMNLLSQNYSVVGEALDTASHLQASGCVDIAASLVPSGATATLPLPLDNVAPSIPGTYGLTTSLVLDPVLAAQATADWSQLTSCTEAPAQGLLDRLESGLAPSLKSAIEAKRGTPDGMGCRPAMAGGSPSLDAQLQGLLTVGGAPALSLPAIVGDLDAIVAQAKLGSTLTVRDAGAGTFTAEHALTAVTLSTAAASKTYDPHATALPIVDVRDVSASFTGTSLLLGSHGFTLGLGTYWERALGDLSLAAHLPTLMPRDARTLLGAVVAVAMHGGKTGCAAVEDLVCTVTGATGCAGQIDPACASALDAWAAVLNLPFAPPTGIDVTLSGQATVADTDGDLLIDLLSPGTWSTAIAQSMSASFTGKRTGP
jgi:hypothetical protein